jgi:hypothetical protein
MLPIAAKPHVEWAVEQLRGRTLSQRAIRAELNARLQASKIEALTSSSFSRWALKTVRDVDGHASAATGNGEEGLRPSSDANLPKEAFVSKLRDIYDRDGAERLFNSLYHGAVQADEIKTEVYTACAAFIGLVVAKGLVDGEDTATIATLSAAFKSATATISIKPRKAPAERS